MLSSSLASSGELGAATGANGSTAKALEKRVREKDFHILSMVCCGGRLFFFFFAAAGAGGGRLLLGATRSRWWFDPQASASDSESEDGYPQLGRCRRDMADKTGPQDEGTREKEKTPAATR